MKRTRGARQRTLPRLFSFHFHFHFLCSNPKRQKGGITGNILLMPKRATLNCLDKAGTNGTKGIAKSAIWIYIHYTVTVTSMRRGVSMAVTLIFIAETHIWGAKLWNVVPASIRHSLSLQLFSKLYLDYFKMRPPDVCTSGKLTEIKSWNVAHVCAGALALPHASFN